MAALLLVAAASVPPASIARGPARPPSDLKPRRSEGMRVPWWKRATCADCARGWTAVLARPNVDVVVDDGRQYSTVWTVYGLWTRD